MEYDLMEQRKKMLTEFIMNDNYKPLKLKEMAQILQVSKTERTDLLHVLESLIKDGIIVQDQKGRFMKTGSDIKTGVFSATQKGFGFVAIEGEDEDIFIPPDATKDAFDGDLVQLKVKEGQNGKRREGYIIKILERGKTEIIGIYQKSRNFGFVVADSQKFDKDIYISKKHTLGAVDGHKVVVHITDFGTKDKNPEGEIIEILGHENDPGVDILSIIKANNLPDVYPEEVSEQLRSIPEEVMPKDMSGRTDIRNLQTVTIDGEDAKDLDDAITIQKNGSYYTLGVHIADVSNYVTENSPLDKEALKRGTSVYLVDRVIPMLPHQLSNGICSLNEGENRLALSCFMDIDQNGTVVGHKIAETILKVDRRMSYTSVKKILEENDKEEINKYKDFVQMFETMKELADILREKRRKRGSINFDFPESKIYLDKKGKPIDIKPYERNTATDIIEDFMLIANETIAEDYFWQEVPFVYRSHEYPDTEKIQKLGIFINNFGYSMKAGNGEIHPKELQKLLDKIAGTPEEALISRLTLRSMKQAKYTTACEGHFGLSTKYYCHFTSPIRRYPDLQIHRIIKENLRSGLKEKRIRHYDKILPEVARQSSIAERRADEAEREVEKLKKAQYMKQFIGKQMEGVISGVTAWGFFVELPNTVEGMVRLTSLTDDYYIYDETHYLLTGENTKKTYKLGQRVKITVAGSDPLLRTIDFEIADDAKN